MSQENVNWTTMPVFKGGEGFYSFPGGNVTYNGGSQWSIAIYRTSESYLVNGNRLLQRVCVNGNWTGEANITKAGECPHNQHLG